MYGATLPAKSTNFNVAFEVAKLYNFNDDLALDYDGYITVNADWFETQNEKTEKKRGKHKRLATHKCTMEEYKTKFYEAD